MPDYIELDTNKLAATFVRIPELNEVPYPVQMEPNLVVGVLFALIALDPRDFGRPPRAAFCVLGAHISPVKLFHAGKIAQGADKRPARFRVGRCTRGLKRYSRRSRPGS